MTRKDSNVLCSQLCFAILAFYSLSNKGKIGGISESKQFLETEESPLGVSAIPGSESEACSVYKPAKPVY